MSVMKSAKKAVKKIVKAVTGNTWRTWDMSTVEARESTVQDDYSYALTQRSDHQVKMVLYDNYYHNKHLASQEIYQTLKERNIPWIPAVVPEAYIHVESQIVPEIPDFEFNGRDDDLDHMRAKQRENVVRFVLENNKIDNMNTDNERRVNKLGNAFWKVAWDGNKEGYGFIGDIVIGNPGPENIMPDPSAFDVDDCEFIIYSYRLHRRKAARQFAKQLKKLGLTIDDIGVDGNRSDTEIFENQTRDVNDDTVQIVEYWFRQAESGSQTMEYGDVKQTVEWEPGDVACSIQINNHEIQYIPKYWVKTGKQNKRYPIIKYCKIPVENSFWDKSEIEPIKELQDQVDRELAIAILNDAFMANDIIVREENALADNSEFNNVPGAEVVVQQGKINAVRRLGGLGEPSNRLEMINFLRGVIQETVGNFDATQGKEPIRVTTSSGIAQLNERADFRKNIKKADRLTGFEKLYELIDWTALEFYDDDRVIFIGAVDEKAAKNYTGGDNLDPTKGPIIFKFNSDNVRVQGNDGEYYYPRIDAKVTANDGLRKSKSFTLSAIQDLIKIPITPQNYKIVQAMINIMDIPDRKEINDFLDTLYAQPAVQTGTNPTLTPEDIMAGLTPEEQAYVQEHPEVLDSIGGGGNAMPGM